MFCINCGTQLPDSAKFCFACGQKIDVFPKPEAPAEEVEEVIPESVPEAPVEEPEAVEAPAPAEPEAPEIQPEAEPEPQPEAPEEQPEPAPEPEPEPEIPETPETVEAPAEEAPVEPDTPEEAPDVPEELSLSFEKGLPTAINGKKFSWSFIVNLKFLRLFALPIILHATWDMPISSKLNLPAPTVPIVLITISWIIVTVLLHIGLKEIQKQSSLP